jgi:hypothetical protein
MKHPASEHTAPAATPKPDRAEGVQGRQSLQHANRRFKVGDDITAADLEGSPFDLVHMADPKRGYIAAA